jgi:hypothetical protein
MLFSQKIAQRHYRVGGFAFLRKEANLSMTREILERLSNRFDSAGTAKCMEMRLAKRIHNLGRKSVNPLPAFADASDGIDQRAQTR